MSYYGITLKRNFLELGCSCISSCIVYVVYIAGIGSTCLEFVFSLACLINAFHFFYLLIMCIAACFRLLRPYMVFQHLNWHCGCTCSVLRCVLIFDLLIYREPIGEASDILICSFPLFVILSGCKWLWSRTCGLWIFYSSIYPVWRRNFSKLVVPLMSNLVSFYYHHHLHHLTGRGADGVGESLVCHQID